MDLSKLSNDELMALKNGDYSKLSNETLVSLKQNQGQSSQQSPNLSPLDQVKQRIGNASGFFGKANQILKAPEFLAQNGLSNMAQATPETSPVVLQALPPAAQLFSQAAGITNAVNKPGFTGNLPADLIKGTPKVAMDTLAQVAPGFVSKAAILTSGAAKLAQGAAPLVKTALKGIGAQGESMSGGFPDSLNAAYNDVKMALKPGAKAASPLYEAAKGEIPQGTSIFTGMYKPEEIVDAAKAYIAKGGQLEPAEAFSARKAVDVLLKSKRVVKDELFALRDTFDNIAKGSENIAKADPAYVQGRMADSLRNIFPQNKYGGASAFKTMILKLTGGLAAPALSPAVQGAAAAGAGVLGRNVIGPAVSNPGASAIIAALLASRNKGNR